MKKILKYFVILLLTMVITGCGEDSYVPTSSTSDSTPKVEKGLYGNKYFNTKFGISISNLPVDDWTVRAFGKDGQGMLRKTETGFIPLYHLLLMEPVPADNFIGPNDEGYLNPVIDANNLVGISSCYVWLTP